MNIEQLHHFTEIARLGSFGKAADVLYMTQQNLSASIKKLEKELGSPVFIRSNTGVTLTPFGKELLPYAKSLINMVNQMPGNVLRKTAKSVPRLSVAASGAKFISWILGQIYDAHSKEGLHVYYHDVPQGEVLSMVASGTADIGFYSLYDFEKDYQMRLLENAGIEFEPLARSSITVSVGSKNPLYSRVEDWVTTDMLKDFPVVYRSNDYPDALQKKLGISRKNVAFNCNTRAGRADLLFYTDCITYNSVYMPVYKKINSEQPRKVFKLADIDNYAEQGYIKRKDTPLTPLAEEFAQRLRELLQD